MSRIPSIYDWHDNKGQYVTFAKLYDARDFTEELGSSAVSCCEIFAEREDIRISEGGGVRVYDIAGGEHFFGPSIVASVHIDHELTTIGSALDLKRVANPDLSFELEALEIYKRFHGEDLVCDGCGEPIGREEYEEARMIAKLDAHGCYVDRIYAKHDRCRARKVSIAVGAGQRLSCSVADAMKWG